MSAESLLSERPWCCPRCKCPRGYVTLETSLSSSIKFEILICECCAHVEHRAADLQSVAALAERGMRGVRHVEFPQEIEPLRWNSASSSPPARSDSASESFSTTTAVGASRPMEALEKLVRIPLPPPMLRATLPWTAAPQPVRRPFPFGIAMAGGCLQVAPFLGLLGLLIGVVAAACSIFGSPDAHVTPGHTSPPERAEMPVQATEPWDSTLPFVCPPNSEIILSDRTIHVEQGAAIKIGPRCKLTLIRCDIKGPTAIDIGGVNEPQLTFQDSRVEGTDLAFKPSYSARVQAVRSLVIGLVPMKAGQRELLQGITAVPLGDIPGAPHAVDPATLLGMARGVSGFGELAVLAQVEGVFVGSNGRVDFDAPAYKGLVRYRFELPPIPPTEEARPADVPLGIPLAKREPERRLYRTVTVDRDGIRLEEATKNGALGVNVHVPPRCSFQQVWDAARAGDVPAAALAHILYNSDLHGQGWWFHVDDTQFTFSIGADNCKR